MKKLRCKCKTWMRYEDDASEVACGECGTRYRIERSTRVHGGGLQANITRALRRALAAMPDACRACQGTGTHLPVAAERAAARGNVNGKKPPPPTACPRCHGSGKTKARRA